MSVKNLMLAFDEIEATSSRNEKEALLLKHADLAGFKEVLKFVYNPYVVTGLAKKKVTRTVVPVSVGFHKLSELMKFVAKNNTGSDDVIGVVQNYLSQLDDDMKQFVTNILIKDLKVGITAKTINKVFGKDSVGLSFIPEHNVMLASKWEDHQDKIKGRFQVSLKLDGIRCTVINEQAGPKFFTRQGHPIEGLIELEEIFKQLPKGIVYDGELIAENIHNYTSDDLFRYTQKIVRKDGVKTGIQFWAFDMLRIVEFKFGKSHLPLEERINDLTTVVEQADHDLLKIVPIYYVGTDKQRVYELLEEASKAGLEGLMVSPVDALYETKRSRKLLKVKKFETADLRIVGFEEHKHGDKLGSLVVEYKGYEVNVGSGFSDVERNKLWSERFELIGTIVEVGYFEESKNQDGGVSLRFPTFKRLRDDKTEPSYN